MAEYVEVLKSVRVQMVIPDPVANVIWTSVRRIRTDARTLQFAST